VETAIAKHTLPLQHTHTRTHTQHTQVETAIAKHTLPSQQLRSAKAKHYTMTELDKIAPGLGFPQIMKDFGGAGS